jgi:uncharacterized membrane protein
MDKQEFVDRLRAALNGRIPPEQVEENVEYYRDYINVEVRKGKSEEEVLKALGDPRLIARTIIQTSGTDETGYGAQQDTDYQSVYGGQKDRWTGRRNFRIPGWLMAILIVCIVFVALTVIFSVLAYLAPVIIVFAAVVFMVKLFRDWLN